MCTVYTGAGGQAVSRETGGRPLVHRGDAATLDHVTEDVSRETSPPRPTAALPEVSDETDVSRETD